MSYSILLQSFPSLVMRLNNAGAESIKQDKFWFLNLKSERPLSIEEAGVAELTLWFLCPHLGSPLTF